MPPGLTDLAGLALVSKVAMTAEHGAASGISGRRTVGRYKSAIADCHACVTLCNHKAKRVCFCVCVRVRLPEGWGRENDPCASSSGGSPEGSVDAVIIDLDPQGTVEAWGGWRQDAPPVVIAAKASNLAKTLDRAREAGAEIAFIDTPPLAQADASAAARAADLVLIPCRPRAFDLHVIRLTATLVEMTRKSAFAVFNGGHPSTRSGYEEPEEVVEALGLKVARSEWPIARHIIRRP